MCKGQLFLLQMNIFKFKIISHGIHVRGSEAGSDRAGAVLARAAC